MAKGTWIAFDVEKEFNNEARYRPNRFRLRFPKEDDGRLSRIHHKIVEVPDSLADEFREIADSPNDFKPRILMENTIDGWEIVKPIKIKRS